MSLNVFLKVVEIQTKLASLFPFIIGVLFSMTYFGEVQWGNTLVFFIGMVVFDMATTAINNYMDFKKPNRTSINMKKILSDNQAFHHNWSAT